MGEFHGLTEPRLCALTGCAPRTARRWLRQGYPPTIAALLRLKLEPDLGDLCPGWAGFRLIRGHLVTPDGAEVRPGEVVAIPIRMQEVAALRREHVTAEAPPPRRCLPMRPRTGEAQSPARGQGAATQSTTWASNPTPHEENTRAGTPQLL